MVLIVIDEHQHGETLALVCLLLAFAVAAAMEGMNKVDEIFSVTSLVMEESFHYLGIGTHSLSVFEVLDEIRYHSNVIL